MAEEAAKTYDIQLHDGGDLSVLAGRSSRCAVVGPGGSLGVVDVVVIPYGISARCGSVWVAASAMWTVRVGPWLGASCNNSDIFTSTTQPKNETSGVLVPHWGRIGAGDGILLEEEKLFLCP